MDIRWWGMVTPEHLLVNMMSSSEIVQSRFCFLFYNVVISNVLNSSKYINVSKYISINKYSIINI